MIKWQTKFDVLVSQHWNDQNRNHTSMKMKSTKEQNPQKFAYVEPLIRKGLALTNYRLLTTVIVEFQFSFNLDNFVSLCFFPYLLT